MSDTEKKTRTLEGRVIGTHNAKTATILVERQRKHGLLGKYQRRSTKLQAQDDMGVNTGDFVRIAESRPYSKTKHHRVVEVITHAKA